MRGDNSGDATRARARVYRTVFSSASSSSSSDGHPRGQFHHARPLTVAQVLERHVFDGPAAQVPGTPTRRIRVPNLLSVRPQPSVEKQIRVFNDNSCYNVDYCDHFITFLSIHAFTGLSFSVIVQTDRHSPCLLRSVRVCPRREAGNNSSGRKKSENIAFYNRNFLFLSTLVVSHRKTELILELCETDRQCLGVERRVPNTLVT